MRPEYRSTLSTLRHVVHEGGVGSLWVGIVPRALRVVGATFILNATRNTLIDFVEKGRAVPAMEA
jgi:Mitochondrial carrier protein